MGTEFAGPKRRPRVRHVCRLKRRQDVGPRGTGTVLPHLPALCCWELQAGIFGEGGAAGVTPKKFLCALSLGMSSGELPRLSPGDSRPQTGFIPAVWVPPLLNEEGAWSKAPMPSQPPSLPLQRDAGARRAGSSIGLFKLLGPGSFSLLERVPLPAEFFRIFLSAFPFFAKK